MTAVRLRSNGNFCIREGWFEKAINSIMENDTNIFRGNAGTEYLGIGSSAVRSLKYWLKAADIISGSNCELTEFGQLLHKYDRYLDDDFSWYLIHYRLASNREDNPVANGVFNSRFGSFSKDEMVDYLTECFRENDENVNRAYVDADFNVFARSYINDEPDLNPEENYVGPLSRMKLLGRYGDEFRKLKPSISSLSYLVIYYALLDLYKGKLFEIEGSIGAYNSPVRIFNLDRYVYLQYLDEMRRNGLVTLNRTASLNTMYFEMMLPLSRIFDKQYG